MSNKLISLSERVDGLKKPPLLSHHAFEYNRKVWVYNDFLKTDLLSNYFDGDREYHFLNRFVPCVLSGKILEDPELTMRQGNGNVYYGASDEEFDIYRDHLSKVWFEGFEVEKDNRGRIYFVTKAKKGLFLGNQGWPLYSETISDLVELNLTLTPYGSKMAGFTGLAKN